MNTSPKYLQFYIEMSEEEMHHKGKNTPTKTVRKREREICSERDINKDADGKCQGRKGEYHK